MLQSHSVLLSTVYLIVIHFILWSSDAHSDQHGTHAPCLAHLFDQHLVEASCYQDWEQDGRWFLRIQSAGIPAHAYGDAHVTWTEFVLDQAWDVAIPIISDEDEATIAQETLRKDINSTECLISAARENRPLGMALNGVPFFSPLTEEGLDAVSPPPGAAASSELLFDNCAGSLEPSTGAYGYRAVPSCLYSGFSLDPRSRRKAQPQAEQGVFATESDENSDASFPGPLLLGFAMDGRKIYRPYDTTKGVLAGSLEARDGRWEIEVDRPIGDTPTWEWRNPPRGYRTSMSFPYIIGCIGLAGVLTGTVRSGTLDRLYGDGVAREECLAGHYLSLGTGRCEPCAPGSYGKVSGLEAGECPWVCPRGFYCPAGTVLPTLRCPPGMFGAVKGLGDSRCSGECQAGYFCLSGSVRPNSNECGSPAYYCPRGSGHRLPVGAGNYSTPEAPPGSSERDRRLAARVRSGQAICEPGTYCVEGVKRRCPPGTFGTEIGLSSSSCSGPCPAGSYCPPGTVDPIPCPAGTFGDKPGLSQETCSGLCAEGHFCPMGSTSWFQRKCPAGRFGASRGLKDSLCAEKHACSRAAVKTGMATTTTCVVSLCDPGFYCPAGSNSPRALPCGSGAFFCPRGSALPSPVDDGFYTYTEGEISGGIGDTWLLSSEQETRTGQARCEPGFFCQGGFRFPCPAGTFGSSVALSSPECSGPCPAGYVCPEGSAAALSQKCGGPRWYCPEGSAFRKEVGEGNYTIGESPDTRTAQAPCPAGSYCWGGIARLCPNGSYSSVPGHSSPKCSGQCPSGRYCPAGTTLEEPNDSNEIGIICPAGRYGKAGMGNAGCTGPCRAGFYCPEGSTSATEKECGSPFLYCPAGVGAPMDVTPGWYATGGKEFTRTGQEPCVAATRTGDREVKTPPSGIAIVERCPDNTVGWNETVVVDR